METDKVMHAHAIGLIKPGEYWGGLLEYPDYLIGESGDIISLTRKAPRKLKPARLGNYVGYVMRRRDGSLRKEYKHRLVAEVFYGPCPHGMECRHLDGDRSNCRFDNLRWGTRRENAKDRVRHGTTALGERNPRAVLTQCDVRLMRGMRAESGATYRVIAEAFGVSTMTAYRAVVGKSWGHA